jgi:DNA repair exonuclease SbcCD ATPase subunit
MALINCPECQKEISDKVKACPHCGYPLSNESSEENTQRVEVTDIKINSQKLKPAITGVILIGLVIVIGILIFNNARKSNYITNLGIVTKKMLDGGVIAEELTGITHDVWYNTIYEKRNSRTDKYTMTSSTRFWSDFNSALLTLSSDSDIKSKKQELEKIRNEVENLMKLLNDPPKDQQNSYNDLDKLYRAFTSLVELAINPSGSLTSYTSNANNSNSEFMGSYNKLKIYIK